jgi:hypothetical protein
MDVSDVKALMANKGYCLHVVIPVGKGFNVDPAPAAGRFTAEP